MWLPYTIALFFILYLSSYFIRIRKSISSKFKNLIECFQQLDKDLKIEYENAHSVILFTTNNHGSINASFTEFNGILQITIEVLNNQNFIESKEWIFMNSMNQYLIFDEIITTFLENNSVEVIDQKRLKKANYKNVEKIKTISVTNLFLNKNLIQSTFCLAFNSIKILENTNGRNNKSAFELLLFNCTISFQKIKKSNSNYQWSDYLELLIQYLDNKSLLGQIKDSESYFNHRFEFYSKELERIKTNSDPHYEELYFYFYEKPLTVKSNPNLGLWNKVSFINTVLVLICEIEEKTSYISIASI